jgi:hypothetical protein
VFPTTIPWPPTQVEDSEFRFRPLADVRALHVEWLSHCRGAGTVNWTSTDDCPQPLRSGPSLCDCLRLGAVGQVCRVVTALADT